MGSNRRISFNEEVHVFDMSKPPPKSPRQSKIITPILKQSPNVSSDEEESQIGTPKSMKNSGNQTKPFWMRPLVNLNTISKRSTMTLLLFHCHQNMKMRKRVMVTVALQV